MLVITILLELFYHNFHTYFYKKLFTLLLVYDN